VAAIVLVHGIGQEQRSADELEAEWVPALADGLRVAGYSGLADRLWRDRLVEGGIQARMAFYGDCFRRQGAEGLDPGQLTTEEDTFAKQVAHNWLERAANDTTDPRQRHEATLQLRRLDDSSAKGRSAGAALRSATAGLARVRWFAPFGMAVAERFVSRALAQLTLYLNDDSVREYVLSRVFRLIDPDTRVLVSHSLGTVVAYEAAHQLTQPLPLLITLGSPLGLRTSVYERLRPQPPRFPPRVGRWVNITARDDITAAPPDLSRLFGAPESPGAVFESNWIDNGAKPHTPTAYLTRVETARPIGETFDSGRP
jgi:hypothetical protein